MTYIGMSRQWFGNNEPPIILELLNRLYVTAILQDLYQALLRPHDPMYQNQKVEVMLRTIEEVQIFFMEHLDRDSKLSDVNIIS